MRTVLIVIVVVAVVVILVCRRTGRQSSLQMQQSGKATLSRAAFAKYDGERWNTYNNFLAMSDLANLSPVQRKAYLAYWYASEVENGGHLQYFLNRPEFNQDEVIQALEELGADEHAAILKRALAKHASLSEQVPTTGTEYIELQKESGLAELDLAFGKCKEQIIPNLLKQYLDVHEDEFIEWIP